MLADTHLLGQGGLAERALFPGHFDRLPRPLAERIFASFQMGITSAYTATLVMLRRRMPILLVHLGDVTCGSHEQGMKSVAVQRVAAGCMAELRASAQEVHVCHGNHDTGYHGANPNGGMTRESLNICEEIFGPSWWMTIISGALHLGVSSPLAAYRGKDTFLLHRQLDQRTFVGDILRQYQDLPWVFYGHDPKTPSFFVNEIADHEPRLIRFVYGDVHAPWVDALYHTVDRISGITRAKTKTLLRFWRRSTLCPSVAPLWWRGHAYLEALITSNGATFQQIDVPMTRSASVLPTRSAVRSLGWMLKAYVHG